MGTGRIKVTIKAGRLEARVAVVSGEPEGLDEIQAALSRAGVSFGIDEVACGALAGRLADQSLEIADELVASGTAPQPGADGRLELEFELGVQTGAIREDDSVDFKDRDLLKTVGEGDVIALYTPAAKEGEEGRGVDGKGIAASGGKDCLPRLGEGVSHDSTTGELRASRAGVVQYQEGGLFDVVDHHLHQGDVDLHSGHLEMTGSVTIQGAVTGGLEARATADIDVKGMVDGGSVYVGGSATISAGVIGGESGRIEAQGNILVRHAQGARLKAGLQAEVMVDAVNSTIDAKEIVIGNRLLGGNTRAECSITVRQAGSSMGAATALEVGVPLLWGGKGKKAGKKPSKKDLRELRQKAYVDVLGTAHPGVTVCIGSQSLKLDREVHATRFQLDPEGEEIVLGKNSG